ncbi:hypothetical protein ACKKBG_A16465 [Auxenochlorella protothecoides x Auxenochlorella symbiontica]|uniref:Anamorsin homolog n=1 Tax=Auxenochlorella protothecoides TaxID=3075 RepID=A0A1D1ZW53_AUXPR
MALLAVTGTIVDTAFVQEIAAAHALAVSSLKLVTQATKLEDKALPASAFDTVVSVASTSGEHSLAYLGRLALCLRPGGALVVSEPGASPAGLQKNLTLAGLGTASAGPLDSVVSSKPAWETGARAAISLRKKPAAVQAAPAWKLSVDDEDDDIIDDEQLLTAEDLVRPAPAAAGCGPAVSKACKNCTCGRAEATEPVKLTKAMLEKPTSGCGSCALGDAYRCGGCPYRGLPAFELGKKIELPSDFLVTDA